jgi:hypothetical protein
MQNNVFISIISKQKHPTTFWVTPKKYVAKKKT